MKEDFSEDLEIVEQLESKERKEIADILDRKMAKGAKNELEIISEINSEFVKVMEGLKRGKHPIECYKKLKDLRKRQEQEIHTLKQELELIDDEISDGNEAVKKILEMESKMAEVEDRIIAHIKENRFTAHFKRKDLDRFLSKVSEAVTKRRDQVRSFETGGVFRIRENDGDLYFDRYIHAPPREKMHKSYDPQKKFREVRKKVTKELEQDINLVSAHSHPPGFFQHSDEDIRDIEQRLKVKGLSRKVGVLAVRESETKNSDIWLAVEVFIGDGNFLPISVEGVKEGRLKSKYPLIHRYNELVVKANLNDKKWYDYL